MRNCLLVMVIAILFIYKTNAQENIPNDSVYKEIKQEVIVSAARIDIPLMLNPAASTVISEDEFKTSARRLAIDDYLRLVPGVRIDNQANGERVHLSIRGQGILSEHGIRGTRIILDGIPLNDPTGFAPDFYDVDFASVSRIEVLRGPSSALYGGGASAGIINIETPDGSNSPFAPGLFFSAGSYDFYKTHLQASGGNAQSGYFLSFSRTMGDGYRVHSVFNSTNLYEKAVFAPSKNLKIRQILAWTDFFNENPEGLNLEQMALDPRRPNDDAIPMNEYQNTKRVTGGVTADYTFSDDANLQISGFLRHTNYKEPGSKYIWDRSYLTPGSSVQLNLSHNISGMKNNISIGSDLQFQTIDEHVVRNLKSAVEDTVLISNQLYDQTGLGIFLLDRLMLSDKLSIFASLRYDIMNNKLTDNKQDSIDLTGKADFNNITTKVGVAYIIRPELSLFANFGQGFLPPATEELANNPAFPGGFNKNLTYASSWGPEIGVRGYTETVFYEMDLFYLSTKNDFDRYRIEGRPLETFYRNNGSSRRFGAELEFQWNPFKTLTLQLAYTYSNFKYVAPDSIKDNWLPNSPEHQLSYDVEYRPFEHLAVGFGGDLQSMWYIYPNNPNISQDGFVLTNARITYDMKLFGTNLQLGVFGKNIFDVRWVAFTEPDPDGNSYQPGQGREFFGQVRIGL